MHSPIFAVTLWNVISSVLFEGQGKEGKPKLRFHSSSSGTEGPSLTRNLALHRRGASASWPLGSTSHFGCLPRKSGPDY